MRNCKNVRDVCPTSKLCPPCDAFMKDYNKRLDSQGRQQSAQDQAHNQNRNLDSPGSPYTSPTPLARAAQPETRPTQPTAPPLVGRGPPEQTSVRPPTLNAVNFPSISDGVPRVSAPQQPPIDITKLQNTYNELRTSSAESPLMLDMFALMLNIH